MGQHVFDGIVSHLVPRLLILSGTLFILFPAQASVNSVSIRQPPDGENADLALTKRKNSANINTYSTSLYGFNPQDGLSNKFI